MKSRRYFLDRRILSHVLNTSTRPHFYTPFRICVKVLLSFLEDVVISFVVLTPKDIILKLDELLVRQIGLLAFLVNCDLCLCHFFLLLLNCLEIARSILYHEVEFILFKLPERVEIHKVVNVFHAEEPESILIGILPSGVDSTLIDHFDWRVLLTLVLKGWC